MIRRRLTPQNDSERSVKRKIRRLDVQQPTKTIGDLIEPKKVILFLARIENEKKLAWVIAPRELQTEWYFYEFDRQKALDRAKKLKYQLTRVLEGVRHKKFESGKIKILQDWGEILLDN